MYYMIPKSIFNIYNEDRKSNKKEDVKRIQQLNNLILIPFLYSYKYKPTLQDETITTIDLMLKWCKLDSHHRKISGIIDSLNSLSNFKWFDFKKVKDGKHELISMKNKFTSDDSNFICVNDFEIDSIFESMSNSGNLDLLNLYVWIKSYATVLDIESNKFGEVSISYKQIANFTGIRKAETIRKGVDILVKSNLLKLRVKTINGYDNHYYSFKEIKKKRRLNNGKTSLR